MKTLTNIELKETNGGCLGCTLLEAVAEIQRQMDAIERLGNLTGTTDDIH